MSVRQMNAMPVMDILRATPVVIIATVGALALGACGEREENINPDRVNAKVACETVEGFDDFSTNSDNYNDFLPKAKNGIDSTEEVQDYVGSLFGGEDGPLGKQTDPASLAALVAVVTEPARDKKATDPRYNYAGVYNDNNAAYVAEGGEKRAQDDCADTAKTLNQVTSYNERWAAKGEKVTQLIATRDTKNQITGLRLANKVVKGDGLSGAQLELPRANNDLDGFNEALITEEGEMFVKGVTLDKDSRGDDRKDKGGSSRSKDDNKGDNQSQKNQAKSGGASSSSNKESEDNRGTSSKENNDGGSSSSSNSNNNSDSKGSSKGQSQKGNSGGGGSGTGNGTGGGKGGEKGGGCGGSCGSGTSGGSGGSGGGGCGNCGGGGSQPVPEPTPEPTPTPRPEPTPEPTPTPRPEPTPEPKPTPTTPTTTTPTPIKPPMTCDPNIDDC